MLTHTFPTHFRIDGLHGVLKSGWCFGLSFWIFAPWPLDEPKGIVSGSMYHVLIVSLQEWVELNTYGIPDLDCVHGD